VFFLKLKKITKENNSRFGTASKRDLQKRPQRWEVSAKYADVIVLPLKIRTNN